MECFKGHMKTSLETLMDRAVWGVVIIPGHYTLLPGEPSRRGVCDALQRSEALGVRVDEHTIALIVRIGAFPRRHCRCLWGASRACTTAARGQSVASGRPWSSWPAQGLESHMRLWAYFRPPSMRGQSMGVLCA